MFQRNGPSAGAEEDERLDLEKPARLEAGLVDPVSAIQPAPTAERQHREGLSFWQAIKTMFKYSGFSSLADKLSLFRIEHVVDRALSCSHRSVLAVRYTRLCPGPGLDRPLPRAALDTLDYPVLDAAVFHAQPTSEARVVNFAQMGPPLLAAFRLDV